MLRIIFLFLFIHPQTFAEVMTFQYSMRCQQTAKGTTVLGVHAHLEFQDGRINRFFLPRTENLASVDLAGKKQNDLKLNPHTQLGYIFIDPTDDRPATCTLQVSPVQFLSAHRFSEQHPSPYFHLALQYSPYLVIRPEQKNNIEDDLPQGLSYSVLPDEQNPHQFSIIYTAYFSDENTWSDGSHYTDQNHHADNRTKEVRYGRTDDIEWVYRVTFEQTTAHGYDFFKAIKSEYHTPLVAGIASNKKTFEGDFLSGTQHPILYNATTYYPYPQFKNWRLEWGSYRLVQNLYDSQSAHFQGEKSLIGYHFIPEYLEAPLAREAYLFRHPWMIQYTDEEQNHAPDLTHYLYFELTAKKAGAFPKKSIAWEVSYFPYHRNHANDLLKADFSFRTENDLDRLGEDLFQQQSYSAISLDQDQKKASALIDTILADQATLQVQMLDAEALSYEGEIKAFFIQKDAQAKSGFKKIELSLERTYQKGTPVYVISKSGTFAGQLLSAP